MEGIFNNINQFKEAFEIQCIQLIVEAYRSSIADNKFETNWNENDFTDTLNSYISNNSVRLQWNIVNNREHYIYDSKGKSAKGFADSEDRIDLRLTTINSQQEFSYYFEAKRLKENDSSLQHRYIDTGIDNFKNNNKYPKGILLGYQVQGDISNTVNKICSMLCNSGRNDEVLIEKTFALYEHYYESNHPDIGTLKHLIFDYTMSKLNK